MWPLRGSAGPRHPPDRGARRGVPDARLQRAGGQPRRGHRRGGQSGHAQPDGARRLRGARVRGRRGRRQRQRRADVPDPAGHARMKNLTPAELAVVSAVDRDRIADDLAALVRTPSVTGDEAAVQTEAALRMATAGLEVTRIDADPAELAADPDFPGMEAARTVLPVVAGTAGSAGADRRVIICGHVDTVAPGDPDDWTTDPFGGEVREGRLYGRGSLDMKAGVVAGLAALRALIDQE